MNRYQLLLQERADLVNEGHRTIEAAQQANRALTAEEQARDETINTRVGEINAELAILERDRTRLRQIQVPGGDPRDQARITGVRDRAADDRSWGFANLAEHALSVREACRPSGRVDERLLRSIGFSQDIGAAPSSYHQEVGSSEGYMVPPQFSDTIWELVTAQDDLLQLVGPEPTSSNVVMKLADETTPWGSTGVQAAWRTEAQQMTPTKLATSKKFVTLEELYAFVLATDELLQDAPRLNDRLTRQSARAISWKASDAIMWGTGAGQPLGFMNAPALVTVSKETGQAAATLAVANLAKMYARLLLQPGSAPVWIGNRDILPQLIPLAIGNQPVWLAPMAGLHDAPGGNLFGSSLRWSEHASTLGTLGDLVLIDPQGYYAVQRDSQPQFASSIHLYFDYGVQAFRWTFRFGGEPFLSAAVSPAHGSNTKSSFVTLQAR